MASTDSKLELESLMKTLLLQASNKVISKKSKKANDALASHRKNALPALTEISERIINKELKDYALEKINLINEGKV